MEQIATFRATGAGGFGEIGDHDTAEHIAPSSKSSGASSGEIVFRTREVETFVGDNDAPDSIF